MSAAGNSASREAAAIRARARGGLWRRLLVLLGFRATDARTEAVAARWELGGEWEARTAAMLAPLTARGWHILNDRALPGWGRANLDHVLIPPNGAAVVVLDTKRWDLRRQTVLLDGRVCCGMEDRHEQVEKVAKYAAHVARLLGLPAGMVWPLLVVHGSRIVPPPPLPVGRLEARAEKWPGVVHVLGPQYLVPTLASGPVGVDKGRAAALAWRVAGVLPPYPR